MPLMKGFNRLNFSPFFFCSCSFSSAETSVSSGIPTPLLPSTPVSVSLQHVKRACDFCVCADLRFVEAVASQFIHVEFFFYFMVNEN